MKMVSKLALAAALAGSTGAMLAAPAVAAKKEAAPTGTMLSTDVRVAATAAQGALASTPRDLTTAEAAVGRVEAAARSDYERYVGQSLRLALESARSQGRGEYERANLLAPLLDAVIANPATPKEELGLRFNERGNMAVAARKTADAARYFERAREAGYTDADLPLNLARTKMDAGDLPGGIAELQAAVTAEKAAGRKPPESWYKYAMARLDKARSPQADEWTRLWLSDYGTPGNWRAAAYQAGLQGPNAARLGSNRLDLYRLLYATKSLAGLKEYLDYADVALNTASLPEEARTVLKEGLASGTIPASSPTTAALQKSAAARLTAATAPAAREKAARAGAKPDLAVLAGDAYFATRNFTKSAEMYRLADTKGVADKDRNNLHLGMALALAGSRDEARAALALVSGDPLASIARLWTTYATTPPIA